MIKNVLMQIQVLHAEVNCKTVAEPTFEVHGEEGAEQSKTHRHIINAQVCLHKLPS